MKPSPSDKRNPSDLLHALSALLHDELQLHRALRDELAVEAAQDGRVDGASLLKQQQKKQHLVRQIQDLEAERMALVGSLAEAWQEPPETLTLRRIIPRCPPDLAGALGHQHAGLLELVQAIHDLAKVTSGNAQARLKAVDATLAVIHEAVKVHSTYSEAGRLQAKPVTFKYTQV